MANNIRKELLGNSLALFERLQTTGVDKYNTKEDLLILSLIDEVISEYCRNRFMKECILQKLIALANCVRDSNPSISYCRINLNDYKHLGKKSVPTYINCL